MTKLLEYLDNIVKRVINLLILDNNILGNNYLMMRHKFSVQLSLDFTELHEAGIKTNKVGLKKGE